jgi:3-oxoacyl-[acyl-carrier protein] reductase
MVMTGVLDRIALVTGAGSAEGIGFATAKALAAGGARVALTSTTKRIFERLETLGEVHAAFTTDLTSAKETDELIRAVNARFGRIDIVVNNAGMVQQGTEFKSSRIEKMTDEDWQRHLALNVTTAFNVIRAVLPLKAAMTGLTRTTAIENASLNITCNAVLPGWIATASSSKEEILAGKATPTKRPGSASEVAAACLFLASEEASYINGAMLVVDGGNSIVEYKGAGDDWY